MLISYKSFKTLIERSNEVPKSSTRNNKVALFLVYFPENTIDI